MNAIIQQTKGRLGGLKRRVIDVGTWLTTGEESLIAADAVAFLDPIDEICAEPAPRHARTTLYSVAGLFLSLLAIAAFVKVDIVVTASGRLVTSTPPILLQPVERAIIRELRVHAGDQVHKGDILATLDPTFAQADLGSLSAQHSSYEAQAKRLDAELNDKPYVIPANPSADEQVQFTLYQQRQANYRSRLKVFSEDIERLNTDIKATEQDNTLLNNQLSVARDVEEMRLSLLKSQNGSRLNYLDAQSLRMRTEQSYQDSVSRLADLHHEVQSKQAEEQAFIEDWRRQILESLSGVQTQVAMVSENMTKATLMNDLVVVTAPTDGIVLDVAQRSVGSIMHEAEPLVTIIPADADLVADIGVSSSDVGSVKTGDDVVLKVDAFPYSRHGMLKGRLKFISEESAAANSLNGQTANPETGAAAEAFHRGQVELTDTALHGLPKGAHLIPGMTLHAEIKVGARSILGYFLTPVTRGLSDALREP